MNVRLAEPADKDELIRLISEFRITMYRFRGSAPPPDLPAAERKLLSYQRPDFVVYVAGPDEDEASLVAYMICRRRGDRISVEALYVMPEHRRQGVGNLLYDKAEEMASDLGDEPLTNWVHPNNDRYISFLRNRGYLILSQIELRKPRVGEGKPQQIKVGKNIFEYCC
jgi:ribosomal protein S18 acetylase RimI-like enzyme